VVKLSTLVGCLWFAVPGLFGHYLRSMAAERAAEGCWSIGETGQRGTLLLEFVGTTPTQEFRQFLAALSARLPDVPATLVFDLRHLGGHNPEAKEPMKDWLLANKLAIREIVVVVPTSKVLLKMVTAAIGLAVGVKITIREELAPDSAPASLPIRGSERDACVVE
jgi:hypothetical protein